MGWFRFDDRSIDHPKFLSLSDGAFRLWIEGGAFCNRHLTDGLILRSALNGFRYVSRKRIEELVAVSLWDQTDSGFLMHDYLDWNDSKAVVEAKKEAGRERTRRWRDGASDASRDAHIASGLRITAHSDHLKEKERSARFDDFWDVYPRKVGKAAAERVWHRLKPNAELLGRMVAALERQKRTPQWTKDNGEFIPHARTWLHQQRWNDEVAVLKPTGSYQPSAHADYDTWREVCHELHGGECGNYQAHQFRLMKEQQVAS